MIFGSWTVDLRVSGQREKTRKSKKQNRGKTIASHIGGFVNEQLLD
jgi:hypothetical protein